MQDAEDAAAETFGVAWNRISAWSDMEEPGRWLYGVARKIIGNQQRASTRYGEMVDRLRGLSPESSSTSQEETEVGLEVELAWAALDRLSASQQELIMLIVSEELTYEVAAEVLGISMSGVRSRLYRARRRLRREYSRVSQLGGDGRG